MEDESLLALLNTLEDLEDVWALPPVPDDFAPQAPLPMARVVTTATGPISRGPAPSQPQHAFPQHQTPVPLPQTLPGAPAGAVPGTGLPTQSMYSAAQPALQSRSSDTSASRDAPTSSGVPTGGKRARQGSGQSGGVKEQIHDLEAQLAKKMAELNLLQQQNQRLKDRSRMLEVVIRARDEQVERLKRLREQFQHLQEGGGSTCPGDVLAAPGAQPADDAISAMRSTVGPAAPAAAQMPRAADPFAAFSSAAAAADASNAGAAGAAGSSWPQGADPELPEALTTLDAATLQAYTKMPIDQLMGIYHSVIAQLTTELLKPNHGRMTQMMHNLREFSRAMALMSDKLQLMVSRDVSSVAPLSSGAAAARASPQHSGSLAVDASAGAARQGSASGGDGMTVSSGASGGSAAAPAGAQLSPAASDAAPLAEAVLAAALVPPIAGPSTGAAGGLAISEHVPHTGFQPTKSGDDSDPSPAPPQDELLLNSQNFKMLETSPVMQAHWRNVAAALNLTPQQRADCQALWDLHTDWMTRVHADRHRLGALLNEVLNVNKYGRVYQEAAPNGLTEAQVLRRLHKSVQSEHALLMLEGEVMLYQILTLEQSAKVLIQSWPYIPDPVGIMHAAVLSGQ